LWEGRQPEKLKVTKKEGELTEEIFKQCEVANIREAE
jgi:hypothetical protein